ncbi:NACHT domain-containing protein [Aliivibrio fischeri]|uniref:NACHT domain-containing protein n=1 Tax=Aliivibrio fischeri TaxID=668 RepID=A0A844P286_ALIFS|nr:NACHT domain-containing protein [Aliivibrio fischeri]MUK50143.1 NACHT domain-containing protein [Aliivibrio fischeri]
MEQDIFEKVTDRYLIFRTLLSRDDDVFIDEIYHPLRIRPIKNNQSPITLSENTKFIFPKIACIVGKAGQGKTTILRKIFLNYITEKSGYFPLIITLRKINWKNKELTPAKIIVDEFSELGIDISEEAASYLLQLNRLKVLFDGFDEVNSEDRGYALSLITQTHVKFGAKCIVTTRPGTEIQLYGGEVHNYELMDLTIKDVVNIIEKHQLIKSKDKAQLLDVINTKPDIANILITPIIVDIFISTYNSLIAEPKTIIDFYEQLFQILASTHDRLKVLFERKGKSGLSNRELERVFWTASFRLLNQRNDITYKERELEEAFYFANKKQGFDGFSTHLDVIDKTSLIKQDGDVYSYLHKSIAEFHAAKHIESLSDKARETYYDYILNNYKVSHENVLRYLSKIDEDLFYSVFVRLLINGVKDLTNIFNEDNRNKLTADAYLIGASYDTILLSRNERNNKITFKPMTDLIKREKTVLSYFLMLSSILDIKLFNVEQKFIDSLISEKIDDGDITLDLNSSSIQEGKFGEVIITHFRVKIVDLLDLDLDLYFNTIVSDDEVKEFYDSMYKLDSEVIKRQKIYKEKNALEQFY